ncbi:MAG: hypothetical protein PHU54_07170 [Candidatus Omnitrophica bacterium]|nr:hypothetical protein [Candidatus Omnitrophota bacterium]
MRLPEPWTFEDRPTCDGPRKWAPPSLNGGFGLEVRKIGSYYRAEMSVPDPYREKDGPSWRFGVWCNAQSEAAAIDGCEFLVTRWVDGFEVDAC